MDDRLASLERKLADLSGTIAALERRLTVLESRPIRDRAVAPAAALAAGEDAGADADADSLVVPVFSLVGRTCLVLGGGYLLRALTDAGTLPRTEGTLLGVGYAIVWLLMAYWTVSKAPAATEQRGEGRVRRELGPAFHGAAAAFVAFPLLWEATVRYKLLSPAGVALAMAGITSLALAVAWRRRLQSLAWITTIAALLTTLLLMLPLGAVVPLGFYLTFLGVVTLWMGYSLDWIWLRWPVALVVDLTVVVMAVSVTQAWERQGAAAVMLLQTVLFGAYLVSIAARTLWRSRDVIPFEVVQTVALLVVGFGGAAYVMQETGLGAERLGLSSLVFGAGSYGVAFAFADRHGHWKNFTFYTALAVVFVLAGMMLTFGSAAQAVTWALLGIATAALGYRYATVSIASHSPIYLASAALASGLLAHVSDAFLASSSHPWTPLSAPAMAVLAASAAAFAIPATPRKEQGMSRLPKLAVAIVLLLGAGGTVIGVAVPFLAGIPGLAADAAVVACIRTVVLAAATLLLAWAGGRRLFPEGRWLSYVVLSAGGLKLLIEDFLAGRPSTLFLSLAVYGAALILAPRWARRSAAPNTASAPALT